MLAIASRRSRISARSSAVCASSRALTEAPCSSIRALSDVLNASIRPLCEVLQWKAAEAAQLLDTTTASINSALQRARATLETSPHTAGTPEKHLSSEERELLVRYVKAFEAYDIDQLTQLIHDDAIQ